LPPNSKERFKLKNKEYLKAWNNDLDIGMAHIGWSGEKLERLYEHYEKSIFCKDLERATVIDFGCGGGLCGEWLLNEKNILYYIGLDISKRSINAAKKRLRFRHDYKIYNMTRIETIKKHIKFDIGLSLSVIQHIPDIRMLKKYCDIINNSKAARLYINYKYSPGLKFHETPYLNSDTVAIACLLSADKLKEYLINYSLVRRTFAPKNHYQFTEWKIK
jgi:hypothetical protein